jgi:hypothetical protein
MAAPQQDHWLARTGTIRLLSVVFVVILITLVLADLAVPDHPLFGLEATVGFGAWYGFAACVVLVLLAKTLGAFLKRPDTYYDD